MTEQPDTRVSDLDDNSPFEVARDATGRVTVVYVDENGADGSSGNGSVGAPFKTPNKAIQTYFQTRPLDGGAYGLLMLGKGDYDCSTVTQNWVGMTGLGRLLTNADNFSVAGTEPSGEAHYKSLHFSSDISHSAVTGTNPSQCLYTFTDCYFDGNSVFSSLGGNGDFLFFWDCAGDNFKRITNNGFAMKVQNFVNMRFTMNSQGVDFESVGYISDLWNCKSAQQLILNGSAFATINNSQVQTIVLNGPTVGVTIDASSYARGNTNFNSGASARQIEVVTKFNGNTVSADSADFLGRVPTNGKDLIDILSSRRLGTETLTISAGDVTAELKAAVSRYKPGSVLVQKRVGSLNGSAYNGMPSVEYDAVDVDDSIQEVATIDLAGLTGADFDVANPAKYLSLAGGASNCTFVVTDGVNTQELRPTAGAPSVEVDILTADVDTAIATALADAITNAGLSDVDTAIAAGTVVTVTYVAGAKSPDTNARTSGAAVITTIQGTTAGHTEIDFAAGGTLRWASDGDNPILANDKLIITGELEDVLS